MNKSLAKMPGSSCFFDHLECSQNNDQENVKYKNDCCGREAYRGITACTFAHSNPSFITFYTNVCVYLWMVSVNAHLWSK